MRVFSIVLLLFTGISASFGGFMLMKWPDGSAIQMSTEWLSKSPFPDYFIPGIILFTIIGLGSLFSAGMALFRADAYHLFILASGIAITSWIIVQILMVQMFHFLQFLYGGIGITLLALGLMLWNKAYAVKVKVN